jgi:hypothetical protein
MLTPDADFPLYLYTRANEPATVFGFEDGDYYGWSGTHWRRYARRWNANGIPLFANGKPHTNPRAPSR